MFIAYLLIYESLITKYVNQSVIYRNYLKFNQMSILMQIVYFLINLYIYNFLLSIFSFVPYTDFQGGIQNFLPVPSDLIYALLVTRCYSHYRIPSPMFPTSHYVHILSYLAKKWQSKAQIFEIEVRSKIKYNSFLIYFHLPYQLSFCS